MSLYSPAGVTSSAGTVDANVNPSTVYGINLYNKFGILLEAANGSNGNVIELTSFSIKTSLLNTNTFPWLSNCFNIDSDHSCAKLIEGWENSPDDFGVTKLGFLFPDTTGGGFRLSARYRFLKFNPSYPIDGEDYEFTDGSRENTVSKKEKYYEGHLDYIDESAHDAFSTMMLCNQFQIAGVDYKTKLEDYKPEWDRDGRQMLAQARVMLRKKTGTIYNSNL